MVPAPTPQLLLNFVTKVAAPKAAAPGAQADGKGASTSDGSTAGDSEGATAEASPFDLRFPPFFVKPRVTVAPVCRVPRRPLEELDAALGTWPKTQGATHRSVLTPGHVSAPRRGHGAADTAAPNYLETLRQRRPLPVVTRRAVFKLYHFAENTRPAYFGAATSV